jgi:hypothetical protein
MFSS